MLLESTAGRVGYHMSVGNPLIYGDDVPRGNSGGASSGTCQATFTQTSYRGELPPGITFNDDRYSGLPVFSGTPRQPGEWRGSLTATVGCLGGPDTNSYTRAIPVNWTIEP